MKQLDNFIQEKLKLDKNVRTTECPKNKEELYDIINNRYNENHEKLDLTFIDVSNVYDFEDLFKKSIPHLSDVREIIGIEDWDMSNALKTIGMFRRLDMVTKLDLSNWDVHRVCDMTCMFYECTYLKEVGDLSKWNTKNLKRTNLMFSGCGILKSIGDISKWNVDNLENAEYMFQGCKRLRLDISNWPLHMTNGGIKSIGINYSAEYVKTRK